MVKRKRAQLNKDETEVECVLDNINEGKVIKTKKRKIKQTNKNKKPKKAKSSLKNNDLTNNVIKQQIPINNHDNSASPLSFFKKSSKVIQHNKVTSWKTIENII